MAYCRNCGAEIDDRAVLCVHCGCPVNETIHKDDHINVVVEKTVKPGDGNATASMVLGIVACSLILFRILGYITVLLGAAGLDCAFIARKQGSTGGKYKAGLILSIIAIVFGLISTIGSILALNSLFGF